MQQAALITAVALLYLSVRGKLGVELWAECLTVNHLRLLAQDRLKDFFDSFHKSVTQLMNKRRLTHKDVSHNEGRQHRTTGLNPLSACKKSASARNDFLAVVQAWTPIFERALCKSYSVQASDLLELRKAALGKVPCLFKNGKVHHWSRYSVMGATRSCELLFHTLGRSPTLLTPALYDVLQKDQASGQVDEDGECSDVFSRFSIWSLKEFCELGVRLQDAVTTGSGYCGSVLRCNAEVVWQGELVGLCEVRQSANKYTWLGLEKVVRELDKREDIQVALQQEQQKVLMQKTYVGMCHGAYMFGRAIKLLKLDVPISRHGGGTSLSKARSWKLLQASCRLGLCPKVLIPNISEWLALKNAFHATSAKAKKLRAGVGDSEKVRKEALRLGYSGVKNYSKTELLRKIRCGKKQPKLRWSNWAQKCRDIGVQPNPRSEGGGRAKMSIPEMRRAILEKSTKQDICDVCARGSITVTGKRKRDLINEILAIAELC